MRRIVICTYQTLDFHNLEWQPPAKIRAASGVGEVIVHVAFWSTLLLTVRADEIRGVGKTFEKVTFEVHGIPIVLVLKISKDRG